MVQLKIVIRKHKAITAIADAHLWLLCWLEVWEEAKILGYPEGAISG